MEIMELKNLSQGSRIAFIRKFRGLTQAELGIKCGIDPAQAGVRINQYENNHRHPKEKCLLKLSMALGVDPGYLRFYDFVDKDDIFHLQLWMLIANDPEDSETLQMIVNN